EKRRELKSRKYCEKREGTHVRRIESGIRLRSYQECGQARFVEDMRSVCPEWHLVKGVYRGIFTSTKRSAVPRSLEKVDAEAKVLRMG
ncbi:MAG: hypothetical protein EBR81_16065, partial [Proteobacteria bacterium]|nr:hypothetical protein [Pseudomonadota bacterium]